MSYSQFISIIVNSQSNGPGGINIVINAACLLFEINFLRCISFHKKDEIKK